MELSDRQKAGTWLHVGAQCWGSKHKYFRNGPIVCLLLPPACQRKTWSRHIEKPAFISVAIKQSFLQDSLNARLLASHCSSKFEHPFENCPKPINHKSNRTGTNRSGGSGYCCALVLEGPVAWWCWRPSRVLLIIALGWSWQAYLEKGNHCPSVNNLSAPARRNPRGCILCPQRPIFPWVCGYFQSHQQ